MTGAAFRVASFNIRNGRAWDGRNSWPVRRRVTLAAIEALDADLVGLQEVLGFQLRWLRRHLNAYEIVGASRSRRGGEHCLVLARTRRAHIVDHRTAWFGDEPDQVGARLEGASFPRVATIARVEIDGRPVQFACTHLDEKIDAHRQRSADQLLDWLDYNLATIVTGDFNTEPDDPMFERFAQAGLRHALDAGAGGSNHDFTGRTDGRRLDHILVSPEFDVVDARVAHTDARRLPSDHWPVVADLRLRDR